MGGVPSYMLVNPGLGAQKVQYLQQWQVDNSIVRSFVETLHSELSSIASSV
jgi:hypothetical protein